MHRASMLIKSAIQRVKSHTRGGKYVSAHTRAGKAKKPITSKPGRMKASVKQMQDLSVIVQGHAAYLTNIGKEIAQVHGLSVQFHQGHPIGDVADLISEGRYGMLIGGMESIKNRKKDDDQLIQMKFRAKQRMSSIAKKLKGTITIPRDVIKHLSIIASATDTFMKLNMGEKPTREDLAEMVILHKRTRSGNYIELDYIEKVSRVEALEGFNLSQTVEELDVVPDIADDIDAPYDARMLRKKTHAVINNLVEDNALDPAEKKVMFLRFYVGEENGDGKERSFEAIATAIDEAKGLRIMKERKKAGETHRFQPYRNVRVESIEDGKKVVSHKKEKYNNPVNAKIIKVGPKSFQVQRGKKIYTITGKPPFKTTTTNPMAVYRLYNSGLEKIINHPTASEELRIALRYAKKSIKLLILNKLTFTAQLKR